MKMMKHTYSVDLESVYVLQWVAVIAEFFCKDDHDTPELPETVSCLLDGMIMSMKVAGSIGSSNDVDEWVDLVKRMRRTANGIEEVIRNSIHTENVGSGDETRLAPIDWDEVFGDERPY